MSPEQWTVCRNLLILSWKGQRWWSQCHHFELLTPLSHLWNGRSYKVQILRKMHYRRLLSEDQKLCRNAAGVAEYNSLWKIHPHLLNALSNENVKWYFSDTSHNGWPLARCQPDQLCLSNGPGFAYPWSAHSSLATLFRDYKVAWFDLNKIDYMLQNNR